MRRAARVSMALVGVLGCGAGDVSEGEASSDGDASTGYDASWLEELPELTCTSPLPPGSACVTVEGREYQLPVGEADLRLLSYGEELQFAYEAPEASAAPRLEFAYPGEAQSSLDCEIDRMEVTLLAADRELSSRPRGIPKPCTMTIPDTRAELGASVSGSFEGVLTDEVGLGDFEVRFDWSDITVQ